MQSQGHLSLDGETPSPQQAKLAQLVHQVLVKWGFMPHRMMQESDADFQVRLERALAPGAKNPKPPEGMRQD